MSIVYDYLKQVQQKREADGKSVVLSTIPKQEVPAARARFSWMTAFWVFLVLLLAAAVIFLIGTRSSEKTIVKLYQASAPRAVDEKRGVPAASISETGYVLEGIIYNPTNPFAIINGKTLERNSRIGDYVVVAITPDSVTIKNAQDNVSRTLQL
jgi:hypothetical protein